MKVHMLQTTQFAPEQFYSIMLGLLNSECCVSHKNNILSSEEPPKAVVFTHLWANYKPLAILAALIATLKTPPGLLVSASV